LSYNTLHLSRGAPRPRPVRELCAGRNGSNVGSLRPVEHVCLQNGDDHGKGREPNGCQVSGVPVPMRGGGAAAETVIRALLSHGVHQLVACDKGCVRAVPVVTRDGGRM
jgi:hypothetical protein